MLSPLVSSIYFIYCILYIFPILVKKIIVFATFSNKKKKHLTNTNAYAELYKGF